jgi:cellulose synthase/poly-beta-1,6-N-acetylglucosamine synthase-like glycosyltransferase
MLYLTALLATGLALLPFTIYPLSLLLVRLVIKKPVRPASRANSPSISILFCAYNEQRVIDAKARNLIKVADQYPGNVEILAYLDGCTDITKTILEAHSNRIRVIYDNERRGKSHGMNTLVADSSGEIIVFTDANVFLEDRALERASTYFADEDVGCVCGNLALTNGQESSTAAVGSAYWRFEEWIKQLESDTGSTMGADGSLFAIRRSLFKPTPVDIIDDMHTSLSVLIAGKRVVRGPDFRAFETVTVRPADEFRRKVRISCRAFNCYRFLIHGLHQTGALNVYKFYSHKVIRWLAIFFLAIGGLTFAVALLADQLWGTFIVLVLAAAVSAICFVLKLRPFSDIGEVLLALLSTGVGVIQSLRGKRYQTWAIAASSRPSSPGGR